MSQSETTHRSVLNIWVVTHDTKDFPGLYVVRIHEIEIGPGYTGYTRPTDQFHTAPSLEEIRKFIPAGMTKVFRDPQDDPVIIESWI